MLTMVIPLPLVEDKLTRIRALILSLESQESFNYPPGGNRNGDLAGTNTFEANLIHFQNFWKHGTLLV